MLIIKNPCIIILYLILCFNIMTLHLCTFQMRIRYHLCHLKLADNGVFQICKYLINSKHRPINIQYFFIRNRARYIKNEIIRNINIIIDIELKRYYIKSYTDTLQCFNYNNSISKLIEKFTPIEVTMYNKNANIDNFKYKINKYVEKIQCSNLPKPYKNLIVNYCDYSNIKMIRSVYKINKIVKTSKEQYKKANLIKTFIQWKLRKMIL